MIIDDKQVNFDRKLKVFFYYEPTEAAKEAGAVIEEHILLYSPKENFRFCPNIQVKVKDIINPNNKNNQPGFTAEITIVNPAEETKRIIANHQTWILDEINQENFVAGLSGEDEDRAYDALIKYYKSRVRVKIEAGYEDERSLHTIFEGWVNSSVTYRKGIDDYLVLGCHNFDPNELSKNAISNSVGIIGKVQNNYQRYAALSESERDNRSGKNSPTWDLMIKKLIQKFLTSRPRRRATTTNYTPVDSFNYTPIDTFKERIGGPFSPTPEARNYSKVDPNLGFYVIPTYERLTNDWYKIFYVKKPSKKDAPWNINFPLMDKLTHLDTTNFYTVSPSLPNMLSDLCSWGRADVDWEIDYGDGDMVKVYVFPLGADVEYTKGEEADIKIVDYQNLLEAPIIGGGGQLNINMLFNPDCKPGKSIALQLKEKKESVAGTPSPYVANIQGSKSLALYSQQQTWSEERTAEFSEGKPYDGNVFNIGFPIREVVHTLTTRGNTWETRVTTIPMLGGLKIGGSGA